MAEAPVELTISRLRDALWAASVSESEPVSGGPSARAGTLFHRTMAGLLSGIHSWRHVYTANDLGDAATLQRHAWDRLLGPMLTEQQADFAEHGREALWLWDAVKAACAWLGTLLRAAQDKGWIEYDPQSEDWRGAEKLLASEERLEREIRKPGWRAALRLTGVPDAVLRDPQSGRWCVLEFKLGDAAAAVDLCQVALYNLMLPEKSEGSVALVRFLPQRHETLFESAQLAEAQDRLLDLAARLAGLVAEPLTRNTAQYDELGKAILRTLDNFGIKATLAEAPVIGPAFLRYALLPGRAVRAKKILSLSDDIGVQLRMPPPLIQIEDGVLAVDIARTDRQIVPFHRVRQALPLASPQEGSSVVPLGVDLRNQLRSVNLADAESPHILVAGTAGSGKSEWLRMAVASLLLGNTPATLRLVLVDPKRSAFLDLADSPFLLHREALVFPPDGSILDQLDVLIEEMERRYMLFHKEAVDDLAAYRARSGDRMPRVVCVMDEFADMMHSAAERKLLEARIERLGAKARAAGIHLILATQHPDAKTITARLLANLSVRVVLKTTTFQQSMVALKQPGAEKLLGKGDLFYSTGDRMIRLQAPFLSETERKEIFKMRPQAMKQTEAGRRKS
ncbi:MAG: DNA translocase FtsK [Bryobacterales bacterium]|nr:DNA translocase FtsK [Bryobacterales bacterium]